MNSTIEFVNNTTINGIIDVFLWMDRRVPIIDQCTVSDGINLGVTIERLSDYLSRNSNLVFPHRHNFYHFLIFTKGEGKHSIDFEVFGVEPWQIYFMSPGQIHVWEFEGDMQGYVVNFDRDFFKTLLVDPDYLSFFPFFSGMVKDEVFIVEEHIRAMVEDVFKGMLTQQSDKEFVSVSLLYLFHLLAVDKRRVGSNEVNKYNHTQLQNFLQLLELNYRFLRLPKDYAALLYITPNYLNALCKELLGIPAGEIIRNRIILEAKRLLVIKDFSISEIGYQLNFNDNSYFTKFFKKIEGVTPDEFRRKNYYGK